MAAELLFSVLLVQIVRDGNTVLFVVIIPSGILFIVAPLLGALSAAYHTYLMIVQRDYPLIFLTTLPNMKLLQAYTFLAVYRLRTVLVLIFGLMPALGFWVMRISYESYTACTLHGYDCQHPVIGFVYYCIFVLAMVAFLMLGIALATALTLWWHNHYASAIATLITLTMLIAVFLLYPLLNPFDGNAINLWIRYTFMLFVATLGIEWVARYIARPHPL